MSPAQKRTTILLTLIAIIYFAAFMVPNARGARDENMLRVFSNDETITYPYVVHMLTTPKDIHDFVWRLFIYGDYHYGYLFYFFSMLAVLPVKLIFGDAFTAHTQLNLLLLRQMISVLPMILAAGVLVFLQTRFRGAIRSAALFVLILVVPGIVRSHLWWWHPDALAVLAVALTLLFLDLDHLRLGRFFFLAAAACGAAVAIKLIGFFFVFALAGYVLAAWVCGRAAVRQVMLRSLGFVLVMGLVVILANPFLFYSSQRQKMVRIQAQKSVELSQGYTHDDPMYYQKGPVWWEPTLKQWYGPVPFLLLMLGLVIVGSIWGKSRFANRLILAWIIPYSLYLFYFVAVKPDHYWLPVMPALFSGALNAFSLPSQGKYRWVYLGATTLVAAIITWQLMQFVSQDTANFITTLGREAAKGY